MNAKWPGKCAIPNCLQGGKITIGEEISWQRRGVGEKKSRVWHVACKLAYDSGALGVHMVPSLEAEEETTTTINPVGPATIAGPNGVNASDAATVVELLADVLLKPLSTRLEVLENGAKSSASSFNEAEVIALINQHAVKTIEITVSDDSAEPRDLGVQHEQFETLLKICSTRLPDGHRANVWMAGPAGSGKTSAANAVAKALNLPFYFTGAIAEPYSLLGFKNATGEYQRTLFREAYEHGGVFLFDEYDSSEPIAVMPFNAALANGHCAFPDKVVERHRDCVIIAAANTYGHGATNEYVGRLKQDGAALDRFIKLPWHYDENLERAICSNPAWVRRVQTVRRNVVAKGIKVLVTPRASIYGASLLSAGLDINTVEQLTLANGMSAEQWAAVR